MTSRRRRRSPTPVPPPLTISLDDLAKLPDPALTIAWDHFQAVGTRARAQIARLQEDLAAADERYYSARAELCMRRLERTRTSVLVNWETATPELRRSAAVGLVMDWLGCQNPHGIAIHSQTLEGIEVLHATLPSREQMVISVYSNGDVRCKDTASFNVVRDVPRSW